MSQCKACRFVVRSFLAMPARNCRSPSVLAFSRIGIGRRGPPAIPLAYRPSRNLKFMTETAKPVDPIAGKLLKFIGSRAMHLYQVHCIFGGCPRLHPKGLQRTRNTSMPFAAERSKARGTIIPPYHPRRIPVPAIQAQFSPGHIALLVPQRGWRRQGSPWRRASLESPSRYGVLPLR